MTNLPQKKKIYKGKKVLIVTPEWLAPSLALSIQNEGHDVSLAIKASTNVLKGTIKRIPWADRLEYAKTCDLIVYEDDSNNGEVSELRKQGLSVIGRDKLTDKLEKDRVWASKIAEKAGILVPEIIEVDSFDMIREIIKDRGGKWVLKQQKRLDNIKGLNIVAKMDNSEDILDFLPMLEKNWIEGVKPEFVLQEKIEGHEFATGSYWNGTEFMKDKDGDEICEENWEHKPLMAGNMGESTGEMYTIMQYGKARYSKLFNETLDKFRIVLKQLDFRGDFDINCMVTEKGAYFLEFTPRMGVPATAAQIEIHKSSWYDFLKAMADGKQDPNFEYDDRYTIVAWMYTKPFPFVNSHKLTAVYENGKPQGVAEVAETISFRLSNSEGMMLNFKKDFTKKDWEHIHPDGLRFKDGRLMVANPDGYVLTCSEQGNTVDEAGEKLEEILKKVILPKSFWRNDFNKSNFHKSKEDLEKWGYIMSNMERKRAYQDGEKKKRNEVKRQEVRKAIKKIVL